MDNLLANAVQHILGKDPEPVSEIIPELSGHSGQVALGKPGEAQKRVRARMGELRREAQAELNAKAEELRAEINAEKEIAAAGNFDLKTELEKGTSREQLAEMRAAADLAHEVVAIREDELDTVQDRLELIAKNWHRMDSQIKNTMDNIQSSYLIYLQAHCGGDRSVYRMNPDRPTRALRSLITGEKILRDRLKDDGLVDDLMVELTTYDIPPNYQSLLWTFITDRDKKEHFDNQLPSLNSKESK